MFLYAGRASAPASELFLYLVSAIIYLTFAILPIIAAIKGNSRNKLAIIIISGLSVILGAIFSVISYILLIKEGMLSNIPHEYNLKHKKVSICVSVILILLLFLPFQAYGNILGIQALLGYFSDVTLYVFLIIIALISSLLVKKIAARSMIMMIVPLLSLLLLIPPMFMPMVLGFSFMTVSAYVSRYAIGLVLSIIIFLPMYCIGAFPFIKGKLK